MRYQSKIGKKSHFSQFGQTLTRSSWQPLLLLKLQVSSLGSTTPESRKQGLPVMRTPGKQFKNIRYSSGWGRKRKDDLNRSRLPLFRQGGATVGWAQGIREAPYFREACGSDKGNVNQAGCFGYFLVEMAFVVGQGVISLLGRCRGWKVSGQDKSQIDATGLEHQGCT